MVKQNGMAIIHSREMVIPRNNGADFAAAMKCMATAITGFAKVAIDFNIVMWHIHRPLAIRYPHGVRY